MMTRSLAENYPYSKVYKARIRGAGEEWAEIVERLEARQLEPLPALQYLIAKLLNSAEAFKALATHTVKLMEDLLAAEKLIQQRQVLAIISRHM